MFNNILLPTDGAAGSLRAASIVADLAKHNPNAKVMLICAISLTDPERSDLDPDVVLHQNNGIRHAAEKAIRDTSVAFAEAGIQFESKIVEGDPVSCAIVDQARKEHFDVIAMASRGLSKSENDRHYIGSVTDHVLRRVEIPVLVLPIREEK